MPTDRSVRDPDIDYLLQLLGEYTGKLRLRAQAAAKMRLRSWLMLLTGLAAGAGSGVLLYSFSEFKTAERLILATLALAIFIGTSGFTWIQLRRESRYEEDAIAALQLGLERLVRRASQIEDHGSVDFTQRIALELQLAEAEAVLREASRALRDSAYHKYGRSVEERYDEASHSSVR